MQSENQIGNLISEYDDLMLKYDNLVAQNTYIIQLKQIEDCCQLDKVEVMLTVDKKCFVLLKWIPKEKYLKMNIQHNSKKIKRKFH